MNRWSYELSAAPSIFVIDVFIDDICSPMEPCIAASAAVSPRPSLMAMLPLSATDVESPVVVVVVVSFRLPQPTSAVRAAAVTTNIIHFMKVPRHVEESKGPGGPHPRRVRGERA